MGEVISCPSCGMETTLYSLSVPEPSLASLALPDYARDPIVLEVPKPLDPTSFVGILLICVKVLGSLWIIGLVLLVLFEVAKSFGINLNL